jgi:hypothetical protein
MKCLLALLGSGLMLTPLGAQTPRPPAVPEFLQSLQDDLLDSLVGSWQLTGTMQGQQLQQACSAQWVLNHQFVQLHCRETKQPPLLGLPYEADMYIGYDGTTRRYGAHLLDIFGQGASSLGYAERTGSKLVFLFEDSAGTVENSMSWTPGANTWHVSIRQRRNGQWSAFAEKELRRPKP